MVKTHVHHRRACSPMQLCLFLFVSFFCFLYYVFFLITDNDDNHELLLKQQMQEQTASLVCIYYICEKKNVYRPIYLSLSLYVYMHVYKVGKLINMQYVCTVYIFAYVYVYIVCLHKYIYIFICCCFIFIFFIFFLLLHCVTDRRRFCIFVLKYRCQLFVVIIVK